MKNAANMKKSSCDLKLWQDTNRITWFLKTKSINNDASDHEMSSTKSIVDLGNALCTHWSRHIDKHKNKSF